MLYKLQHPRDTQGLIFKGGSYESNILSPLKETYSTAVEGHC